MTTIAEFYGDWLTGSVDEVGPQVLSTLVDHHRDESKFRVYKPSAHSKWMASSALQKSIRRGLDESAAKFCDQLIQVDADYMMRRLHTVAAEDLGIANLLLMAAHAKGSTKTFQAKMGGTTLVARALVAEMAHSPKCRLADELKTLDLREFPESLAEQYNQEIAHHSDNELLDMLANRELPLSKRMLALIYYTRFEPSDRNVLVVRSAPKLNWRTALMNACQALGTPPLIRDLCWVYAGRMMERQAYCLPIAWDTMCDQTWHTEDDHGIVDSECDGWPAAAIDGHTSPGKKALKRLMRDSLSKELAEQHVIDLDFCRERAFHLTIFRTEGHLCRQRLTNDVSAGIRVKSSEAVVSQYCHTLEDGRAMLAHGQELLDRLNIIRQSMAK